MARAQNTVWNGAGTNWNNPSDWTIGVPTPIITAQFSTTFTNQPTLFSSPPVTGGIYATTGLGQDVFITGPGTLSLAGNLPATSGPGGMANVGILLDDAANHNLTISSDLNLLNTSSFLVNNAGTLSITGNLFLASSINLTLGSTTAAGTGDIDILGHIGGPSSVTFAADNTDAHNQSLTLGASNNFIGFNLLGATNFASTTNVNFNDAGALAGGPFYIGPTGSGAVVSFDNTSGAPITLSSGASQIWDSDFTFVGTNDLNFATGGGNIKLGLTTSSSEITVNVENGMLTENDPIVNGSANTLIVRSFNPVTNALGGGTLSLTANSTFSGGAQILNGTVITAATAALGSGQVVLAPNTSTTLQLNAPIKIGSLTTGINFPGFSGGSLYTVAPTVMISGGGGSGATAIVTIAYPTGGGGGILVLTITNAGSNYTSDPTFTLVGGETTGTPASFSTLTPYSDSQITSTAAGNDLVLLGSNTAPAIYTGVISGPGGLVKVGTGAETLTNANTYTGATNVNQGTLTFLGTSSTQSLTVAGGPTGPTFNYDPTSFANLNVSSLAITNSTLGFVIGGTGAQVGTIVATGAAASASGAIQLNILAMGNVNPGTTFNLIQSTAGLAGATYTLGTVFDPTDFTISGITVTPSLVSITTAPAAALPTAYWKGAYTPMDNIWAASDGVTMSNWTTDAAGTINTPVVPGPSTDVFFSAAGAANQSSTYLGASMSINSLTITDPTTVVLHPDGNTLTVASFISVNTAADDTLGADIAGGASLNSMGTGTLTLLGNNSYTGPTNIIPGSTLQIGNGGATGTLGMGPVLDNGTLVINRYGSLLVPNMIVGPGNVDFVGLGVTYLQNTTNNYSGATLVDNGVVNAASLNNGGAPSSIGNSSNAASNLVLSNGTLQYTSTTGPGVTDRLFTIGDPSGAGGDTATIDSSSPVAGDGLTFSNSGPIAFGTVAPHTLVLTGTNPGGNRFVPVIGDQGPGDPTTLIKEDGTSWTLFGQNTYTGPTEVHGGTLQAGVASILGVSGAFGLNSAVIMSNVAGATLDLNGFNTQIGSLTGGGALGGDVSLTGATLFVGGDNTSPGPFGGVISGTPGSILDKIGTGVLTLTNVNTYSGGTLISGGASISISGGSGSTPASTVISGSAILLAPGGQLANTSTIKINGGSLIFGAGNNNAVNSSALVVMASSPGSVQVLALNGTSQTIGSLSLSGTGGQNYIDLTNGGGLLTLTDVGTWTTGLTLDIVGWQGSTSSGDATHQIDLGSLAIIDFTPAQLAAVDWTGASTDGGLTFGSLTGAQIIGGQLVPIAVPETTTFFVSFCLLGLIGWNRRQSRRGELRGIEVPMTA